MGSKIYLNALKWPKGWRLPSPSLFPDCLPIYLFTYQAFIQHLSCCCINSDTSIMLQELIHQCLNPPPQWLPSCNFSNNPRAMGLLITCLPSGRNHLPFSPCCPPICIISFLLFLKTQGSLLVFLQWVLRHLCFLHLLPS